MDFKTIEPAKIIHNKELRSEFVKVYNQSGLGTLKECDNCAGAFHNAILKYQNKYKMAEKQYVLKSNAVLHFQGKDYVNANLTDEVGAAAVRAGYGHLFTKIALNVEEIVQVEEEVQLPVKRTRKRKV